MSRYSSLIILPVLFLMIHKKSFGSIDSSKVETVVLFDEKTSVATNNYNQKESNWSSYIGMGVGYLPFTYYEFTPAVGVYYRDAIFNEVFNATFINIIYKDMVMLENRLHFTHMFGYYHDYYNVFYNHVYIGFNPLVFFKKNKLTHSFFLKYGIGVTNNCQCGDDVPYRRAGMSSRGFQIDYLTPLNDFLKLHISAGNNLISSDVPMKYNFTHWHIGIAMRLF